ncbi:hypothetical protein QRD89_08220 [Halobacillus sp. ACCC02827]|uniref:hypothetical protein n=1 Tax=Bacillaceae TaxID=186817 RepID=UPI00041F762D|nr:MULTISPECIES: hypothetical protein [Bacillaceae]QHT46506.1 hypothetical protein M662_08390 [Bacillus sp. SB49]WJE17320.1 hypothetical protein QRD89_08220 [Halobacillus sp. ACCC02827]
MNKYLIMTFFAVLLLAGCIPKTEDVQVLKASPLDYELYLYTDSDEQEAAKNYMSALLDWKVKQQDTEELEFKQQEMNSDNLRLTKEDLPALVVKKEGKTVKTIKGDNRHIDILTALEDSINMTGSYTEKPS